MFEVGRVVMKIAGRDAGKLGAVVEVLDEKLVLIDGAVRRRKVNMIHLEPMDKVVKIKKGAAHAEVIKALEIVEKKTKKKDKKEKVARPKKTRVKKFVEQPKKKAKKKEAPAKKVEEKKPKAKKESSKPKKKNE